MEALELDPEDLNSHPRIWTAYAQRVGLAEDTDDIGHNTQTRQISN